MGKKDGKNKVSYDIGVLVKFKAPGVHDEDIEKTLAVISQLWCVESVEPIPADYKHHLAVAEARRDLSKKLWDVLHSESP